MKKIIIFIVTFFIATYSGGKLDEFNKLYGITKKIESQSFIHINALLRDFCYAHDLLRFTDVDAINQILLKEEELNNAGYICFYHGQKSIWGLQQDLTKSIILELIKIKMLHYFLKPDFLFIQNPHNFLSQRQHDDLLQDHKNWMSAQFDSTGSEAFFRYLPQHLFINLFLFGNVYSSACSSLSCFQKNTNESITRLHLDRDIFAKLNLSFEFYQSCLPFIEELIALNEQSFVQGRLLQIAVPAEQVDDYVYIADSYANRREVEGISSIKDVVCTGITTASWIRKIVNFCTPRSYSAQVLNDLQFVMPMTDYYALNPASDIKIIVYRGKIASTEIYQHYLEKMQQLAKRIAARVIENNKLSVAAQ